MVHTVTIPGPYNGIAERRMNKGSVHTAHTGHTLLLHSIKIRFHKAFFNYVLLKLYKSLNSIDSMDSMDRTSNDNGFGRPYKKNSMDAYGPETENKKKELNR